MADADQMNKELLDQCELMEAKPPKDGVQDLEYSCEFPVYQYNNRKNLKEAKFSGMKVSTQDPEQLRESLFVTSSIDGFKLFI